MNTAEIKTTSTSPMPRLDKEHGFYNSTTIAQPSEDIFIFCQNSQNVEKVLTDLPMDIENFFDLTLISAERTNETEFEIKWQNKPESKVQGTLTFILQKAPANRGTILSAIAVFKDLHWKDEEPSTLMNVFIKRMKALIETGVLATTKGQPSGREEITQLH